LEAGVGFLKGDSFRVAVAGEACGEAIGGVEEPSIACFGREQDKLVGGDDASVMSGGPSLDGANLVGESKPRAVAHSFARSGLDRPLRGAKRMDVFTKLFGEFLVFVYHCFDRIVIHGYLTALSRPELVVHFFREIVGAAEVSKEALSQRTPDYQNWVEAYARNHSIRSSGPRRGCARRTTCCRGCAAWRSAMPTASTSSSRAWSKGRPSASACRSTRPRTRTTASSRTSAAASRITTSMSATRCSDRWLCGWLPSSP